MVAGWLNHKQLQLIKGIGKTPGDTYSAENDPVVVNLMGGAITLNEWSPNIPAVKNNGVWSDSPLSDGRQLLAAPVGNVTEKITILISDNSYLGAMRQLSGFNQMVSSCRDFWQSDVQIDPVYLAWWAGCGVGPQYALLYNIELVPDYLDSPTPSIRVNMTLEREPYWRPIPPGANPKLWTYYVNESHPQFNNAVASLISGSDHLITQTIQNKFEWTPAGYGLQTTPITQNFIDITAAQVPGDAPALVEFGLAYDYAVSTGWVVGKTSKPLSKRGHDNTLHYYALNLNIGDFYSGSLVKTAGTNLTGVKSNNSSATYYYGERATAGIDANYVTAAQWGPSVANGIMLDKQMYRGTYAVFCRCYATNVGANTDHKINLLIEEYESGGGYLTSITLPETYVIQASAHQPHYLGTVSLPLTANRSVASLLGYGTQVQESASNLRVTLQHKCLVGGARTFRAMDVIFMPLDEGLTQVLNNLPSSGFASDQVLYDNTGYLTHGMPETLVTGFQATSLSGGEGWEIRGQNINLSPKVNQRLYFLNAESPLDSSFPNQTMTIRLNIVPRWSGIRDV